MINALLVLIVLLVCGLLLIVGRALKIMGGEDSSWPKTVTCFSCGQVISEAVAGDHDCSRRSSDDVN